MPVVGEYRRGERGREAPRSLLDEKSIEVSANIECCASCSCDDDCDVPLKGSPSPPFIATRRDGVHAQGNGEVVVFPRIAGVQWSNTVGSTLWGVAVVLDIVLDLAEIAPAPC